MYYAPSFDIKIRIFSNFAIGSPVGIEQAKELGKRMKEENVTKIYSSPFLRTLKTACCVVKEATGSSILIECGLSEWLGKNIFPKGINLIPFNELEGLLSIKIEGKSKIIPYFPESAEELYKRTEDTINALLEENQEPFLIVSHAAPLSCIVRYLKGEARPVFNGVFRPASEWRECDVVTLKLRAYNGKWKAV